MKLVSISSFLIICALIIGCGNSQQSKSNVLPGIETYLVEHREFGSPSSTQSLSDWEKGKRQRIQFTSGRNLLFYLQNGKVITVYEDTETEGRKKIWGIYSSGDAEYAKDVSRQAEGEIPDYTMISAINLLAGGRHADILIPSLSRSTPLETRSNVAFAILEKEGLKSLAIYSTQDAYNADYSFSFAEQHPEAHNGYLGSITTEGNFDD